MAFVLLPSAGLVGLAGPASAAAATVTLTSHSVSVEIKVGDTLTFVNGEAVTLGLHQVTGKVGGSAYDSGSLAPGERSAPTPAFSSSGTFSLQDQRTAVGSLVDPEVQSVTVVVKAPAASTSPTPTSGTTASPSSSGGTKADPSTGAGGTTTKKKSPAADKTPEPSRSQAGKKKDEAKGGTSPRTAAAASPVPTGGTGYALQPNLDTGALVVPGSSGTSPGGPAPAVAPVLPDDPALLLGQGSPVSYSADGTPVVRGALPGSQTVRRYGLPIALAVVALAGVGSLLVRVLLAEPAARRSTASAA